MNRIKRISIFFFFLICGSVLSQADQGKVADLSIEQVVRANNSFAFALVRQLARTSENIVFSPISITSSLAMTTAGAQSETLSQMQKVFYWRARPHSGFGGLLPQLLGSPHYELHMANRLWGQKGENYYPEILRLMEEHYQASLVSLDFKLEPDPSRQIINQWVEEKTKGKISDLLPEDSISEDTDLVLTNAIYFYGSWLNVFDKARTRDDNFYPTPERPLKVPMMQQTANFSYAESPQFQYLELPYKGGELAFVAVLPKSSISPNQMIAQLNVSEISQLQGSAQQRRVEVFLPRFKIETTVPLKSQLESMGMPLAFDEKKANLRKFRPLSPDENLYISNVYHKAFLDLNEEGTEAAAATAVVIDGTRSVPPPPVVFRANKPFVYLIQHKKTGAILFMGRLLTPK